VDIHLSDGYLPRDVVPISASMDVYKALELRDEGKDYIGKGCLKGC
jgi:enolase